jgi:hypothetical protein
MNASQINIPAMARITIDTANRIVFFIINNSFTCFLIKEFAIFAKRKKKGRALVRTPP